MVVGLRDRPAAHRPVRRRRPEDSRPHAARVHRRRRLPHAQPKGGAGHERFDAGRFQPRLEACRRAARRAPPELLQPIPPSGATIAQDADRFRPRMGRA